MKLLKEKFYGLNNSRYKTLLYKFGLNEKCQKFIIKCSTIKELNETIDTFVRLTISKKETIIKNKNFSHKLIIDNGSYSGYKFMRGLPIKNQRTKTNSRTSRRENVIE